MLQHNFAEATKLCSSIYLDISSLSVEDTTMLYRVQETSMTSILRIAGCAPIKSFAFAVCLLPIVSWSQTITGIEVNPTIVKINEPILVKVNLDLSSGKSPWCGLALMFGDGNVIEQRISDNNDVPFVVHHVFQNPGTYTIRVDGKGMIRGLRSVLACNGNGMTAMINVVDPVVERGKDLVAQEFEQRKKELEIKELNYG